MAGSDIGVLPPGFFSPAAFPFTAHRPLGALLPVSSGSVAALVPVQFVPDGYGLDITAALAPPPGSVLQFANTGREILYVAAGAVSQTVQVDIGLTVLGQSVANFPAVTLINGHVVAFGPFHSLLNLPGGNTVQVTLSTSVNILAAVLQSVAVL